MRKYLSCTISQLPVLEANSLLRVSGRLPGLRPQHLQCSSSWSTGLARVSDVIDPIAAILGVVLYGALWLFTPSVLLMH
jgi:hypothetical protein